MLPMLSFKPIILNSQLFPFKYSKNLKTLKQISPVTIFLIQHQSQ